MDGTPQQVFSHASQLEEIGLDVPQTTRLRMALAQRGIDMPDDIFDAQGAAAFCCRR